MERDVIREALCALLFKDGAVCWYWLTYSVAMRSPETVTPC